MPTLRVKVYNLAVCRLKATNLKTKAICRCTQMLRILLKKLCERFAIQVQMWTKFQMLTVLGAVIPHFLTYKCEILHGIRP